MNDHTSDEIQQHDDTLLHEQHVEEGLRRIWPLIKCEKAGREDFYSICIKVGMGSLYWELEEERLMTENAREEFSELFPGLHKQLSELCTIRKQP